MKRVLTALVLIPFVLLAVFKAPSWLFTLLVGAVALLALKEYLDLVEAYGVKPVRWLSYMYVLLGFGFVAFSLNEHLGFQAPLASDVALACVLGGGLLMWPFVFLMANMRSQDLKQAYPGAALSPFGIFYIAIPMIAVASLQRMGWFPLIFAFFSVWAGDIVAMYTGKAIGKHKMAPRISPNKTWEGAVGSVAGSVIACWVLTCFAPAMNHSIVYDGKPCYVANFDCSRVVAGMLHGPAIFVFAILLNIAAQLGDLVESLIKRGANVKDSGTMLPGHGGILDRIDALLFAAPVALVLFEFVR